MEVAQTFLDTLSWLIPIIIVLSVWDVAWKLIALWKSARNSHMAWFICIAIFYTVGILPIIYILTHRNKSIKE